MNWIFPVWNVFCWIHSAGFSFRRETCGWHAEVPILADTIMRHSWQDWWLFSFLGHQDILWAENPQTRWKKTWPCGMDACAAKGSNWVYSWWLNPILHLHTVASHPIWVCLKMGPTCYGHFLVGKFWEKAGEFGKNPSKSCNVQIPNPFCGSWCLKRSHFLHQPPSRISSVAFCEAAWLVPVLSWLLCWCWLQLPWPYLWLHTWASPDQMKFSPGCTSKKDQKRIDPILIKLGFLQGCSMMFREFILVGTATFPLCFSVRIWFSEETRDFCCKIVTFLVVTGLERGFSSTTWKEHKEDPPEWLSRSKWYYCACIYLYSNPKTKYIYIYLYRKVGNLEKCINIFEHIEISATTSCKHFFICLGMAIAQIIDPKL